MKYISGSLCIILTIIMTTSCKQSSEQRPASTDSVTVAAVPRQESYGKLADGRDVQQFILTNKQGVEMKVINYGGIITSLRVPDRQGVLEDVVLGFDSLSSYETSSPYFGALIGRYGNRIAGGRFQLDGQTYTLAQNNNGEHLHGGIKGFDKVFWDISRAQAADGQALYLRYVSPDGEEGYPGTLYVEVVYILTDDNELKITYKATTDKKTIVNLTQHTYFNLTGNKQDILGHELTLYADKFLPVNKTLIPTGELKPVEGTPFDFRKPVTVGARIQEKDEQLLIGKGYDHCWVLSSSDSLKLAATLYEPTSGRVVEVRTTEPGIQFYSGNFLDGTLTGKGGVVYPQRFGLCLETEHFPDSPHRPAFPSVVLEPGAVYQTTTSYKFLTR